MRVTAWYLSGRVSEFNTETFTTAEPFKDEGGGANVATEFALRLDRLESDGLVLEVYWHSAQVDEYARRGAAERDGRLLYRAGREPGRAVRLVSKAELGDISRICVDGEEVVRREGDDLVDALRFSSQEARCYSDGVAVSTNARAVATFGYLRRAHPLATDQEVADMLGYPLRALLRAREEELAQAGRGEGAGDGGLDGIRLLEAALAEDGRGGSGRI